MSVRAGLLVVGHVDEKSRHIAGDYPELFRALLAPFDIEVVPYAVDAGEMPATLGECDGWLCSPSRLSVYDDEPWIADVEEFMRAAIAKEAPFVGICFGHQLLARALGGTVEKADVGWKIGAQEYEATEPLPWLDGTTSYTLIASHQDQVVEPPSDAVVWSRGDGCPVAGMRVGDRAWTVQGHPEFTPGVAAEIFRSRVEKLGADAVERAVESMTRPLDNRRIAEAIVETVR